MAILVGLTKTGNKVHIVDQPYSSVYGATVSLCNRRLGEPFEEDISILETVCYKCFMLETSREEREAEYQRRGWREDVGERDG